MTTESIHLQEPRFHLDEHRLPGTAYRERVGYLNHGRHTVRNRAGIWIHGYIFDRRQRGKDYLALSIAPSPDADGEAFHEPLLLSGPPIPYVNIMWPTQSECPAAVCLLIDQQDQLELIYQLPGGIEVRRADASGGEVHARLSQPSAWSDANAITDAGATLWDAVRLPSGEIAVYYTRDGALYEHLLGGTAGHICDGARRATVDVEADGTRHVAFERNRIVYYIRSNGDGRWTDARGSEGPELVAQFCSSWPSIAVTDHGTAVIAYQGEGKVDLKQVKEKYHKVRRVGGSTISYAVLRDGRWRIHDLLRSSEILLHRFIGANDMNRGDRFVPFMEELWRPALSVDRHGVLWLFYVNTTRRHIYFSRFQGKTFGERYEARGPFDALSRVMLVQRDARHQPSIGFAAAACNEIYFDALPVPTYASEEARRVVFLDNLEVDELVNVDHEVNSWKRHPRPVFGFGISGETPDDHIAWCQVMPTDGGFEMQYMAQGALRSNAMPGRAFSADGIHWEKRPPIDHHAWTLDGKPFLSTFWRPIYLADPQESDPSRHYKGLCGHYRHVRGVEHRFWDVVASPDGKHWHTVDVEPVVLGDISCGLHLFRDDEDPDPQRRYKVNMLQLSQSGRGVVVFTSPDAIHWSRVHHLRHDPDSPLSGVQAGLTGPLALDPDAGENPWEEEVHDASIWRENGLLMMHYDAFYFAGNQHTQKALAVSRDGRHYWRIKRGAINLPHGNCGEWDSGRDRTSVPIRVGDELRLYFCGMPAGLYADPDDAPDGPTDVQPTFLGRDRNDELRPWRVGLARLRADGWGYLRRQRDASRGHMTTIPIRYTGGTLVLNGSGLDGLRVEVCDPRTREPIDGFAAVNCRISTVDSVAAQVSWADGQMPPIGTYRLRFQFESDHTRLYAFGFEH